MQSVITGRELNVTIYSMDSTVGSVIMEAVFGINSPFQSEQDDCYYSGKQ